MARRGERTRKRILKTTRSLLSIYGSNATTLEDIITGSAISKGAFYHHFKSKDAACETVIDEAIGDYRRLFESLDHESSPLEQLTEFIDTLDELNSSGRWINCRLMLRLSAQTHQGHDRIKQKIRQFWTWYTGLFEEMIGKCQQTGELTDQVDAQTQGQLLMSIIAGSITLEKPVPNRKTSISRLARTALKSLTADYSELHSSNLISPPRH